MSGAVAGRAAARVTTLSSANSASRAVATVQNRVACVTRPRGSTQTEPNAIPPRLSAAGGTAPHTRSGPHTRRSAM